MTKTHAEFLEELRKHIKQQLATPSSGSFEHGFDHGQEEILRKIERFQAEQKVNDEAS